MGAYGEAFAWDTRRVSRLTPAIIQDWHSQLRSTSGMGWHLSERMYIVRTVGFPNSIFVQNVHENFRVLAAGK